MSETLTLASTSSVRACLPALEIIHAATLAPSADNNQPWLFSVENNRLLVFADHSRALSSDVEGMFDWMSLGAAMENACIASRHFGWQPIVTYPAKGDAVTSSTSPAAAIDFERGGRPDPLFAWLEQRCTCRRAYSRRPLEDPLLARLARAAAEVSPEIQVDWAADRSQLRKLAMFIAAGDRIRLEHRPFHAELYRQLRLTEAEVQRTRDGLDVRTLELPPGGAMLLRALRSWRRTKALNRLGLSRLLSLTSAAAVWRSGAVGALSVRQATPAAFLEAGRALERLWLTSAAVGLALQPLGSLPIFLRHSQRDSSRTTTTPSMGLSQEHHRRVSRLAGGLSATLPAIGDRVLVMLFRLGYAPSPRWRSLRRPASDVLPRHESGSQFGNGRISDGRMEEVTDDMFGQVKQLSHEALHP